ncbi:hypothetical protein GOBAR_AA08781 [Gossypium barbadense]|uniref:Uncharacterized protein n=1 Tax=Gossypium barbadense TaxID=3634 RepID=A0A2P5Y8E2_GOSBA|nr:hypothetical protein GOBAR_AA08781 [Gossypium barbadense]
MHTSHSQAIVEDLFMKIEDYKSRNSMNGGHNPKTPDKLKLCQNEPYTSPNQFKVGDKVLLDVADPHIVTTTPNEEIPLTVLSIFPFGTVEVSHPKFGTFKAYIRRSSMRRMNYMLSVATYISLPRSAGTLWPLARPPTILAAPRHQFSHNPGGYIIDLTYFIALAIQHQTEWHLKGVISIGPNVTRLARHFGLLNTAAQESSLTLIGQMSPQGISSMLSMRMIERRRGTYSPQYHLAQSTKGEAYEDIPDDVLPQHEDPLTQPPPPSRPIHAAASYADISERLTRFKQ